MPNIFRIKSRALCYPKCAAPNMVIIILYFHYIYLCHYKFYMAQTTLPHFCSLSLDVLSPALVQCRIEWHGGIESNGIDWFFKTIPYHTMPCHTSESFFGLTFTAFFTKHLCFKRRHVWVGVLELNCMVLFNEMYALLWTKLCNLLLQDTCMRFSGLTKLPGDVCNWQFEDGSTMSILHEI